MIQQPKLDVPTTHRISTAWSIAFGGFIIALGIATFLLPKLTPIEVQTLLPWLFIAVSGAKFLYLFSTRQFGNLVIRSIGGLLYFAMGISLLYIPIPNVLVVSFLVGALLVTEGVTRFLIALQWRSFVSWWWILADSFLGVCFGLLIWLGAFPGLNWFLAALFGTRLVLGGLSRIRLSVECLANSQDG